MPGFRAMHAIRAEAVYPVESMISHWKRPCTPRLLSLHLQMKHRRDVRHLDIGLASGEAHDAVERADNHGLPSH